MKAKSSRTSRYEIVNLQAIPAVDCPCGRTRRAFTDDPDQIASLHLVDVSADARTHYHKRMTEIYYVVEGHGQIELDGKRFDVGPGSAILIKPYCQHRPIGPIKLLNLPIPAFDADDEFLV